MEDTCPSCVFKLHVCAFSIFLCGAYTCARDIFRNREGANVALLLCVLASCVALALAHAVHLTKDREHNDVRDVLRVASHASLLVGVSFRLDRMPFEEIIGLDVIVQIVLRTSGILREANDNAPRDFTCTDIAAVAVFFSMIGAIRVVSHLRQRRAVGDDDTENDEAAALCVLGIMCSNFVAALVVVATYECGSVYRSRVVHESLNVICDMFLLFAGIALRNRNCD